MIDLVSCTAPPSTTEIPVEFATTVDRFTVTVKNPANTVCTPVMLLATTQSLKAKLTVALLWSAWKLAPSRLESNRTCSKDPRKKSPGIPGPTSAPAPPLPMKRVLETDRVADPVG